MIEIALALMKPIPIPKTRRDSKTSGYHCTKKGKIPALLSLEQGIGIAAGLSFASLLAHIKNRLLPMALLCLSICLFGIALANNLLTLILSSVGVGFFYSIILPLSFIVFLNVLLGKSN